MFYDAVKFNQPLNKWDVSKVTNIDNMFVGDTDFDQSLVNWDISGLVNNNFMFSNGIMMKNQFPTLDKFIFSRSHS
jgi:surface protein